MKLRTVIFPAAAAAAAAAERTRELLVEHGAAGTELALPMSEIHGDEIEEYMKHDHRRGREVLCR